MRSFLMNEKTLFGAKELWGRELPAQRFTKELSRLNSEERSLFESLRDNRWGDSVRLEQERISYGLVRRTVADLGSL